MDAENIYGAGKNADVEGDLIVVLGCKEARTEVVYGGAENANVKGNVELTITSGSFGKVFGGNNTSGAIFGHIILNIEESGCTPINIDELYLGGYNAPYSVYGYYAEQKKDENNQPVVDEDGNPVYIYKPRSSMSDGTAAFAPTTPYSATQLYADPVLNIISATKIGKVFGGGLGEGAVIYGNPTVNINQAYPLQYESYNSETGVTTYGVKDEKIGSIGGGYGEGASHVEGGIFGGGNQAAVVGNTTINIGTERTVDWTVLVLDENRDPVINTTTGKAKTQSLTKRTVMGANIAGNVYGGGNLANVTGNTQVNICAKETGTGDNKVWTSVAEGAKKVTIAGSVYGGGKGLDDTFTCEKAMVGNEGDGACEEPSSDANKNKGTRVIIGNGTVTGNVYGGGEIGRVEWNTQVITGLPAGEGETSEPVINGNVFGAGAGKETHGYSALVRGNSTVTIQGGAKVGKNVYGGGEKATVGRYWVKGIPAVDCDGEVKPNEADYDVPDEMPYKTRRGGKCTVIVRGSAQIGPDAAANVSKDAGQVFGAGKGVEPEYNYNVADAGDATKRALWSKRMVTYASADRTTGEHTTWDYIKEYTAAELADATITKHVWEYFTTESRYLEFLQTLALVTGTDMTVGGSAAVKGNVYGGSESGFVQDDTDVKIQGGTIGTTDSYGNVFGGGKGLASFAEAGKVKGGTKVEMSDGTAYGDVYGGGERGVTVATVVVNMSGGEVKKDVYGGGALADTNTGNWDVHGYVQATALNEGESITDLYTRSGSGTSESPFVYTKITDANTNFNNGTYYRQEATWANETQKSNLYTTSVNLTGGLINGDAYGGGLGQMATDVLPDIEAKVYGNTTVELNKDVDDAAKGCIVKGCIFGCNNLNGSPQGTTTVHVHKTQRDAEGVTRITNGGGVTNAKVPGELYTTGKDKGNYNLASFDVQAVYGGGNQAAYEPIELTNATTNVIIDGCDRTSIGHVYGGGNAASTPATNVVVNGTYEIGELFGGGNGKDAIDENTPNPGANVGFYNYYAVENDERWNTKEKRKANEEFKNTYVYGSGEASVYIKGGTIHHVFGGSNTKGNVRKTALTMLEEVTDGGVVICPFQVDEAYGGGKSAPMDAEAKLLMACIPGLKAVYGGAQAADVYDDVTLTITNGLFDRVFGGNNISGTIRGKITVNIEETGCKPVIIGELYGGGNLAGYSTYGYRKVTRTNPETSETEEVTELVKPGDTDAPSSALYADPVVNVKSFTSIGNIFGGGYGADAVMVGNPTLNINEVMGENANVTYETNKSYYMDGETKIYYYDEDSFKELTKKIDGHDVVLPQHKESKIGAINNVFGGGNAADVIGDTQVNIGTEVGNEINMVSLPIVDTNGDPVLGTDGKPTYEKKTVVGADIRGNVYGGGNNAEVTGNTNVTIGKQAE